MKISNAKTTWYVLRRHVLELSIFSEMTCFTTSATVDPPIPKLGSADRNFSAGFHGKDVDTLRADARDIVKLNSWNDESVWGKHSEPAAKTSGKKNSYPSIAFGSG